MISLFINTNRFTIIFFILIGMFFNLNVFADQDDTFYLTDKTGYFFWKCDKNLCTTYLRKNTEKPTLILENSSAPSIVRLGKNLIKLFFSCGSPCNYTIFYNSKSGVSRAYEFSVAVNIRRKITLVAENKHLVAYKIFSNEKKPIFKIKRDWSPTATLYSDIIEAKFVNDDIYITYLTGKDFNEKKELIHVTYMKKLI